LDSGSKAGRRRRTPTSASIKGRINAKAKAHTGASMAAPRHDGGARGMLAAIVHSSDAAIISKTLDGIVTSWNSSAERIFGYTASEMIGKPIHVIAAPDRPQEMTEILNRIRRGERIEHLETERRHKDGHIVWISLTVSPIYDESGRIIGASKIASDITDRKRTEVAKGMLAAIVHSSDAAIISKTLDGIVTSWNSSAERIFGYAASEMIGKSIHVIAAPDRPQEMTEILNRVRRGERIEHLETERRHKDGHIVWISLTVSPIYDERGRIIGASKIASDITDRKHTEVQLQSKSEQLEEFSHALGLGPAIVRTLDDKVIFWGAGAAKLYGWPAKEAIGRVSRELLGTEFPLPLPEILSELSKTGRWQGELQQGHKDGWRLVVASLWVLHRRDDGDPVSILQFDWDLTEIRHARSMIEEREARLRSIFDTAPDAVITIDERGIIQSFSPSAERLFGYTAGEVILHNVKMLMPEPHRAKHDGYLERFRRTGEKHVIGIGRDVEAQRKDGTVFPMHLAVGEARIGDTHIFSGFVHDLSTRVRMEEGLRRAEKMEAIGQLTGGIAHDFNNFLTVISGNLEMLDQRIGDAEDREILKDAREASQLGGELAKRLLAIGRRQPLQPRLTDLNALVGGMIDLLGRSFGETIVIDTRFASDLPMIMVDPGQVESALLNLSVNARDAMPKGGHLTIETATVDLDENDTVAYSEVAPGRYVTLEVTDTGTGMTPEVRERAFEPFYTTKGPGAGSGLGLSMVYGFVKQSGGHVQLDSEFGIGTTVRLYLPAQSGEASVAPRVAGARAPRVAGERVLVVEDDPRVRRVSLRRLKELGYLALEADSGRAALKLLDEGAEIHVLFTDIVMSGGMTGIELAQEARRRRPEVKILFTSGYAEPAAMTEGLLTTGARWLGKPYGVDELQSKLRELLDQ
jgi:PAS domain S-box-containing protein